MCLCLLRIQLQLLRNFHGRKSKKIRLVNLMKGSNLSTIIILNLAAYFLEQKPLLNSKCNNAWKNGEEVKTFLISLFLISYLPLAASISQFVFCRIRSFTIPKPNDINYSILRKSESGFKNNRSCKKASCKKDFL